ncbi:hypothetical protein HRW14_16835 [Streptomyces lunaelactis]|uniref:hypothetical protein n=1 Tax=Streptomyces lunaelactis TaxID=1535768 RepID=UPI001585D024|nr:hypothetical protein [Streptomyces lunaelactis]NUK51907.1 hypothetical protein [Streptomyces lunaelactis]NUK63639.1 hypothetical protein [Streptomyces lunaelactis]
MSPRVLAEERTAVRAVVDVPLGVTTGTWAEPDGRPARSNAAPVSRALGAARS